MNPANKHSILLVDDEPEMLYSLQGLLRREFQLFTAESGPAALEVLRQQAIHVLLTDQRMPGMTGIQLLRRVKDEYPATIRVVFTGYADIKAVVDGVNHVGLYRYLTKPWDPDELVEVLHAAAARYEELAEQRRLLADLREYLRAAQQLAPGLPLPAIPAAFVQTGGQLLERLDRVLAH